jgi:hypothetical protein
MGNSVVDQFDIYSLIRKMQFMEQTGRYMGSKSMVEPLWAERCCMSLNIVMHTERTQILHQQGFDAHMPVCHPAHRVNRQDTISGQIVVRLSI